MPTTTGTGVENVSLLKSSRYKNRGKTPRAVMANSPRSQKTTTASIRWRPWLPEVIGLRRIHALAEVGDGLLKAGIERGCGLPVEELTRAGQIGAALPWIVL